MMPAALWVFLLFAVAYSAVRSLKRASTYRIVSQRRLSFEPNALVLSPEVASAAGRSSARIKNALARDSFSKRPVHLSLRKKFHFVLTKCLRSMGYRLINHSSYFRVLYITQ
uniref:Secreted protein n=1 Tax=Ascaris lumbricoides TaxID=6252 RepID=A0A9J2P5X3_ASCLU